MTFHLDPLWADANIDYVGIDWYPPLGDWREDDGGVDADAFAGPSDADYLAGQVAGGEGFDWFYASAADRAAQVRTPIVDTAHGEDWVFRPKDLVGWWSHAHHNRPGGVRAAVPTAWVPGMKPIRLTEFGCAAVDRGGNAPNLFQDPKSSESFLPPYSSGARDDRMQQQALEAVLGWFARPENNPVSAIYGGAMLSAADAWCWDARPYPAFPARRDVWADAGAWQSGHWLNGRLNGDGRDLLAAILKRGGLDEDAFWVGSHEGAVEGYVIDRPMRTRDAIEPLLGAFGLVGAERDGKVALVGDEARGLVLEAGALALPDDGVSVTAERVLEARPDVARVRFIDEGADYQTGSVTIRADDGGDGGGVDLDLPAVCGAGLAEAAARRVLAGEAADRLTVMLGPLEALRLEPGDVVGVEGQDGNWRVERLNHDETPSAVLMRVVRVDVPETAVEWRPGAGPVSGGRPMLRILDLPPLPGFEDDGRPIAVVAGEPWRPMAVFAGPVSDALTQRGVVEAPATVGALVEALGPGVLNRWDEVSAVMVRVEGRAPESREDAAVLGGGNAVAVETADGWEVLQFRRAELVGAKTWRLSGLLRGQQGTDGEMRAGAAAGALVVFLEAGLARVNLARAERGLPQVWRAGPRGTAPGGDGFAEVEMTVRGLHDRPWSPAQIEVSTGANDVTVRWIARSRVDGDVWDGAAVGADAERFRVRVMDGVAELRAFEVVGAEAVYTRADMAADFPGGPGPEVAVSVSQWNPRFGWGVEARTKLFA